MPNGPTSLIEQLKQDEGERLTPYQDTTGNLTIGFGTNLTSGISEYEAKFLFRNRVALSLCSLPPWIAAVIEICYNVGDEEFTKFVEFQAYLASGDRAAAANDLRGTLAYRQNTERYERLAKQIETNVWQ